MRTKRESMGIAFRIILLIGLLILSIVLYHAKMYYTLVMLVFVFLVALFELIIYINQFFSKINKVIISLLYEDYSVELNESANNETFNNVVKLYNKIREKEKNQLSHKVIYNQILNGLDSGILILKFEDTGKEIVLINTYLSQYFGIPFITKWTDLEKQIPNFCKVLEEREFGEFKTTLDIQIDKGERQTFVLQTSRTIVQGQVYYIVLMDSIQRVIDSKQNEAWMSVMKVISHELMNSLAPIHSLAYNMQEILNQPELEKEDQEDIQLSVKTIINRSNHLQEFVDRYRRLTMLPTPELAEVNLDELIESILHNYHYIFKQKTIEISFSSSETVLVDIDRVQIEQVIINLLTNSMHALEDMATKKIDISLSKENKRVYVKFEDNGPLIDKDIVSKIFLPFYTTRKDGAGIGLSLSKSIVEAHNGYLYYQENAGKNTFIITLILK